MITDLIKCVMQVKLHEDHPFLEKFSRIGDKGMDKRSPGALYSTLRRRFIDGEGSNRIGRRNSPKFGKALLR